MLSWSMGWFLLMSGAFAKVANVRFMKSPKKPRNNPTSKKPKFQLLNRIISKTLLKD